MIRMKSSVVAIRELLELLEALRRRSAG